MVAQQQTQLDIWSPEFVQTREFLAQFGIATRSAADYDKDDILKAIRHKGWEHEMTREIDPPGWRAEIREWRTITQSRATVAHDSEQIVALLRSLRMALTWPTLEEESQAFNEQTQSLLGLSASEFIERWHKNELSSDDPRVVHLLIARPLGW